MGAQRYGFYLPVLKKEKHTQTNTPKQKQQTYNSASNQADLNNTNKLRNRQYLELIQVHLLVIYRQSQLDPLDIALLTCWKKNKK